MSGIILLLVLVIWAFVVIKLTGFFVRKMQFGVTKVLVSMVLFVLLFIVPVADDIAGGFQFRAICKQGSKLLYDAEKAQGKTVQLKNTPDRKMIKIVPIREKIWDWVDPNTGETLIQYKYYYAKGGWLSRSIGFPQGSPPYTFDGSCGSKKSVSIFDQLNITEDVSKYYGE